jgi:hypothetical protein
MNSKRFMIIFTPVSMAVQGYVTNDIYSRLAELRARDEVQRGRAEKVERELSHVQGALQADYARMEALVELSRATTTEVVGLRGEFLRKCRGGR